MMVRKIARVAGGALAAHTGGRLPGLSYLGWMFFTAVLLSTTTANVLICQSIFIAAISDSYTATFYPGKSMSEYVPPTIAPQADPSGNAPEPVPEAPEPAPITEQEVGEYREQDRFLPVRICYGSH